MQYTVRDVPAALDEAIREKARREGRSLNQVTIDALLAAFGLAGEVRRRDLSDVVGTWHEDPAIDRALADQRRVDPEQWR